MSLHAIDQTPFAGRDGLAVFLDIFSAGALELRNSGRQFFLKRFRDVCLRRYGANRQDEQQRQKSKLDPQMCCDLHRTSSSGSIPSGFAALSALAVFIAPMQG
jgi:hypothetical protein